MGGNGSGQKPPAPGRGINYWNNFAVNYFLLVFSGAILAVARFFPIDRFPLGFCLFKNITGLPCPTCGFTRSFCDFANGHWADGFMLCPFALLVFAAAGAMFLYNAAVIALSAGGRRLSWPERLRVTPKIMVFLAALLLLLLMANWVYRIARGLA
ncbi:MAG: DUF2752 domain-containing protein [Kiritimatiellia bacterium]